MNESEFIELAEGTLEQIEQALETAADKAGVDLDIETLPGGVLRITFENDTQMIINRHLAAGEIWVAAKSGGFHFRPEGGSWKGTRDGQDLWDALATLVSEQAEVPVQFKV